MVRPNVNTRARPRISFVCAVWAALRWAALIGGVLGEAGSRAITKVFSLVLAAIGVTFIRRGVLAALATP
jgi:small neutral amino acid transporter SnatA (MarC family)